jgi:peptide chain release factor 3
MELEQQRGISITSTVLQFPYRDCVVNLLDTPGTATSPRTPTGCSPRATRRSWCSTPRRASRRRPSSCSRCAADRGLPILTYVNKWDRPGLSPLELIDDIEAKLGLICTPVTWPVGIAGDFRGVVDRRSGDFIRFTRTAHGSTEAPEEVVDAERAEVEEGDRRGARASTSSSCSPAPCTTARCSSRASRRRCSSARR